MSQPSAQEPTLAACIKCGGATARGRLYAIIGRATLVPWRARVLRRRDSPVSGVTCISCGYTEFYAAEPRRLVEDARSE